jgi:hypothetical protein
MILAEPEHPLAALRKKLGRARRILTTNVLGITSSSVILRAAVKYTCTDRTVTKEAMGIDRLVVKRLALCRTC